MLNSVPIGVDGDDTTGSKIKDKTQRSMSSVLMRATLVVALILGMIAGLIQLAIDIGQEKEAVELNAVEFIESVLPAAEEAIYDLDDKLAGRVADGLFSQRAINRVRLFDIDQPMVDRQRRLERTLPAINGLTDKDEVIIRQDLFVPGGEGSNELIGRLEVTLDRSIVAPAIVNRLLLYFLLACFKNFLLGLALVGVIYASMARYFVAFAQSVQTWQPGDGPLTLPSPPRFLQRTEITMLAERVSFLASKTEHALGAMEKTVEERTAMLDRERELNGLQRQFVAMVSHEFRTPLAIIDGSAQRIKRNIQKSMPERVVERAQKIQNAVHRLIELMESVLTAARLDDGKMKLNKGPCELASDITEIVSNFAELNADRRIEADIDNLPNTITADGKLLRQVFSNLVSNAIKYSPGGAKVTIKGWQSSDDWIAVSVADQGVGIPREELAKLCERFFRASTSTGIAGTGIGLYLCRHVVDLHDGRLEIESEVGEGTVFTVHLPCAITKMEDREQEFLEFASPA